MLKKLCTTPGSFYPVCIASMIKPLWKAISLLVHARSYPVPKVLQPYKGTYAYTNWFHHLNCAKIKSMASNQNSLGGDDAEKLSRIPKHQEFKSFPRKDPKDWLEA